MTIAATTPGTIAGRSRWRLARTAQPIFALYRLGLGQGCGSHGPVHFSDKAIASASDRLDITRFVCRVLQGIPQPPDRRVDAVIELDDHVAGPESVLNFLAQYDLTLTFQQNEEDLKRLLLQPDSDAVFA
jgi:hypothetical protein